MRIVIGHLYPELMNIYGDRGNVIALVRRCQWRGLDVVVRELRLGEPLDPDECDVLFVGGGQDREQRLVCEDFARVKGESLREAVERGVAVLAICGGYQLMGHFYRDADGTELPGLSIFDAYTVPGKGRLIGNIVVQSALPGREDATLVGFENHGGRTYLGSGCQPLGRVRVGFGNNGEDGTEGAVYRNAFGTYLHGSVLPKNPWLADELVERGVRRREPNFTLEPLDDALEHLAHDAAARRAARVR